MPSSRKGVCLLGLVFLVALVGLLAVFLLPAPAGLTPHHPLQAHAPVEILASGLRAPAGLPGSL